MFQKIYLNFTHTNIKSRTHQAAFIFALVSKLNFLGEKGEREHLCKLKAD